MPQLPTISLKELTTPKGLAAFDQACREWGVFYLVDHEVVNMANRLFEHARTFFNLPIIDKRLIERTAKNPWGYFDRELTKNTTDLKQVFDYGPASDQNIRPQWPDQVPQLKSAVLPYYDLCQQTALELARAMALNFDIDPGEVVRLFEPEHSSFLRINYYPPYQAVAQDPTLREPLGVNMHTDSGLLTLLAQHEQAGLEVYHDGHWQLLDAPKYALIVNLGDIAQVWSNDQYQAPAHRVPSQSVERLSAPFFLNPSYEATYAPLPTMIAESEFAHYESINWGEFRQRRTDGDYADLGTEVQISDYSTQEISSTEPPSSTPR